MTGRRGYLIVSDLHLSLGRSPKTGYLSRTEDFLFSSEFCAFLDHHMRDSEWQDVSWTLAVNGDFMDFLQVSEIPDSAEDLRVDPSYGLKTGPRESAWKVRRIVLGHERFFEKLAEFLELHRLIIVSGNHDAEFNYPQVQDTFVESVARIAEIDPTRLRERIEFRRWFYFDGDVYFEHGHQYDRLNSFRTILETRLPSGPRLPEEERDDLELPLGSLFVRYLFNRVETVSPIADNIKPPTRFLSWFVVHQPLSALYFAVSDGREVLRRIRRKWRHNPPEAYADRDRSQKAALADLAESLATASHAAGKEEWLERLVRLQALRESPLLVPGDGRPWRLLRSSIGPFRTPLLLGVFFFVLISGVFLALYPLIVAALPSSVSRILAGWLASLPHPLLETFRWLFLAEIAGWVLVRLLKRDPQRTIRQRLRQRALEIQQLTGARFILMGHTHDPDLLHLPNGGLYLNSGTWTKVFSDEDRVFREEKELTFARIVESHKGLKAKLLKWEGRLGEARLAYVFADPGGNPRGPSGGSGVAHRSIGDIPEPPFHSPNRML